MFYLMVRWLIALGVVFMCLYGIHSFLQAVIDRSNVVKELRAIRQILVEIRDNQCGNTSKENEYEDYQEDEEMYEVNDEEYH